MYHADYWLDAFPPGTRLDSDATLVDHRRDYPSGGIVRHRDLHL